MKTHFEEIFAARGWVVSEVSRKFNIPHMTLRQHLKGTRSISAEQALKYERLLGIPRSELRPDLWPPEETTSSSPAPAKEKGGGNCVASCCQTA